MASLSWIENSNAHAFDSFYTVSIVSSTCTISVHHCIYASSGLMEILLPFDVMHGIVQLGAAHPGMMDKSVSGIQSCSGSHGCSHHHHHNHHHSAL